MSEDVCFLLEQLRVLNDSLIEIENIYNNSPCGYHSVDENGFFIKINDTELNCLGYSREELIGKVKIHDLIKVEFIEKFENEFLLLKKQGHINNLEFELKTKSGYFIPVMLNSKVIYNSNGVFSMINTNVFDISEKKCYEKELLKKNEELYLLNEEKDKFLEIVFHDLQNHLNLALFSSGALKKRLINPSSYQVKLINAISNSIYRMNKLIFNMLNINKINLGLNKVNIEKIDLIHLLKSVINSFIELGNYKSINIVLETIPNDVFLNTDPDYLIEIIENLISNAIKFSYPKKSIFVRLSETSEEIVIEIEDQGQGLKEDEIQLIFNKFQKLSSTPTDGEKSNGLGLYIVKYFVTLLGGRIFCRSIFETGTTFIIYLPK